jgi:hypothetical protein
MESPIRIYAVSVLRAAGQPLFGKPLPLSADQKIFGSIPVELAEWFGYQPLVTHGMIWK